MLGCSVLESSQKIPVNESELQLRKTCEILHIACWRLSVKKKVNYHGRVARFPARSAMSVHRARRTLRQDGNGALRNVIGSGTCQSNTLVPPVPLQ